jgi:hypothetical protein
LGKLLQPEEKEMQRKLRMELLEEVQRNVVQTRVTVTVDEPSKPGKPGISDKRVETNPTCGIRETDRFRRAQIFAGEMQR